MCQYTLGHVPISKLAIEKSLEKYEATKDLLAQ